MKKITVKKMFMFLLVGAIFTSAYTSIFAYRTWTGPTVNGMKTTCLEVTRPDGDISESRFKSITNLPSDTCRTLSKVFYDNIYNVRNYTYMYVQYFYNTTIDSVLCTANWPKGYLLSNNGGRSIDATILKLEAE